MFDEELRTRHERKKHRRKYYGATNCANDEMECLLVTKRPPAESETPREKRKTDICARRRQIRTTNAVTLRSLLTAAAVVFTDVPGSNELGGAILLRLAPEVEPDADADADKADTNDECVNDAKERMVGVAAAVQDGSARAPAEPTLGEQAVRRDRKEMV
ncbi:hypothetical protein B0H13DRAFT_1935906 [Mycena leptocephala]|nr:hypothetical protein B0H13DRAFT_1935906 [Mycena leptocephala]